MKWERWIATGFGVGYLPVAPGSAGSLVGFFLFWLFQDFPPVYESLLLALLLGLGVYTSGRSELFFKMKDPSQVVIDEIGGMVLVLILLPSSWPWRIAGFFIFRCFDIIKPPPTRSFEKLPGGWGIMLDDLWAAGYTVGLLRLVERGIHLVKG